MATSGPTSTDGAGHPSAPPSVPPTHAVAAALAAREGVEPTDLPPLHGSIDTEAMDAVLRSAGDARLTFTHLGYEVTVTGDGDVSVVDPTA